MKTYEGVYAKIQVFLTSVLVGVKRSASRLCRFIPGTHWRGDRVGPRAGLGDMESDNSLPYRDSNTDPSVIHPAASRYTDWATEVFML
jgi:hypothetical protein